MSDYKIRQQSVDGSGIEGQTTLDGDLVRIPTLADEAVDAVERKVATYDEIDAKAAGVKLNPDEADPFVEAQQSTLATIGGGR